MSVRFSNENIYVQFIDDVARLTVCSASTVHKSVADLRQVSCGGINVAGAKKNGTPTAEAGEVQGQQSRRSLTAQRRSLSRERQKFWRTPPE